MDGSGCNHAERQRETLKKKQKKMTDMEEKDDPK